MLQLVSLEGGRPRQECNGESVDVRRDMLQMLLTFDANSDDGGGVATGAEECST